MWHRLALHFGKPVRDVQRDINSAEFAEWVEYFKQEPDTGTRLDWLFTALTQRLNVISAALGNKLPDVTDRLIDWGGVSEDKSEESEEVFYQKFKAFCRG